MTLLMDELVQAGLVTSADDPHLSDKGREWLHRLEDVDHQELDQDAAADLIFSTSGLYR